ncbi:dUTP diphosphatase [Eubacterium ventriosum]|mgnify:CR=1 FL=1|jgi:dUTP pyrophosphatase|uniref:dUTP diphosphatase n=1 Tax=Eubacterium ventriosum TaxID=39496 RepID=UPI00205C30B9|nr:MAG TPA: dUTPase [Caudoviricetes sp.]
MQKIAKFEKVSWEQFYKDWTDTFPSIGTPDEAKIKQIYYGIDMPKRATKGSAGYDFFSPIGFTLSPGETIKIPTGIRCEMNEDWVLMCFPRSGLGFKYRMKLDNSVGIIDSDYAFSDNEGHIFIKLTNEGNKKLEVFEGNGFAQGIFLQYGITEDDNCDGIRNGGFGSTTK